MDSVVVLGQIARDLVLTLDELPEPGSGAPVTSRRELLGGKGANQAVALAQLGAEVALVGAVGTDDVGEDLLRQATADGIDVSAVVRRGADSALIVDVLEPGNQWRYLEYVPRETLVAEEDVLAAEKLIADAGTVLVQLQQPAAACLAAARLARAAGVRVVLDGAPPTTGTHGAELVEEAHVIRADAREAEQLTGARLDDADSACAAAREVLRRGPELVVLEVSGKGNVFVTNENELFVPLEDTPVVDTTGAGDALIAALVVGLHRGAPLPEIAAAAVTAAGRTTGHPGGRPSLG
ncbi:PfkB family carbohydrate kinase [Allokutzneria albata]|uniref:Ribokinase n=1 Tax=Allokutzneria albata TaxID=211114 RepID=A0A1G9TVI0_ALLAB|nr:PfkB family carbohydrate kinase [Allokutzneria albata]SDM51687.1 ribokinase [Allokutzneria albata]